MSVRLQIWGGASMQSSTGEFRTARDARRGLLEVARMHGADLQGNGGEGFLVTGKGSGKRRIAAYEITVVTG